jgi:hypothetical protein
LTPLQRKALTVLARVGDPRASEAFDAISRRVASIILLRAAG